MTEQVDINIKPDQLNFSGYLTVRIHFTPEGKLTGDGPNQKTLSEAIEMLDISKESLTILKAAYDYSDKEKQHPVLRVDVPRDFSGDKEVFIWASTPYSEEQVNTKKPKEKLNDTPLVAYLLKLRAATKRGEVDQAVVSELRPAFLQICDQTFDQLEAENMDPRKMRLALVLSSFGMISTVEQLKGSISEIQNWRVLGKNVEFMPFILSTAPPLSGRVNQLVDELFELLKFSGSKK